MSEYTPPKPGPITAVQVISWVKVGLLGLGVCGLLALSSQLDTAQSQASTMLTLFVLVYGAFAVVFAVVAVNIAKGRNWARILVIVVEAINLALVPLALSSMQGVGTLGTIGGVVLSIVVIVCASQYSARQYCEARSH